MAKMVATTALSTIPIPSVFDNGSFQGKAFAESTTDFEYTVKADGTVNVTKYKGTDKDVIIPSTLDGKVVTEIGRKAFSEKGLTRVIIPKT